MEAIGIIGFGNMGASIATGLKRKYPDVPVYAYDQQAGKIDESASRLGIVPVKGIKELCDLSGIIVIAVKPQDLENVTSRLSDYMTHKGCISIAAGRTISYFRQKLNTPDIARFMPNIAATTGCALTGVSFSPDAEEEFRKQAMQLAQAIGTAVEVSEYLMPAITAVSGSGIAYCLQFLHALAMGGVHEGLPYPRSLEACIGAMEGAISLIKQGGQPAALIPTVTSPAGTTIEGIKALEEGAFTATIMEAVSRTAEKAKAMEH